MYTFRNFHKISKLVQHIIEISMKYLNSINHVKAVGGKSGKAVGGTVKSTQLRNIEEIIKESSVQSPKRIDEHSPVLHSKDRVHVRQKHVRGGYVVTDEADKERNSLVKAKKRLNDESALSHCKDDAAVAVVSSPTTHPATKRLTSVYVSFDAIASRDNKAMADRAID